MSGISGDAHVWGQLCVPGCACCGAAKMQTMQRMHVLCNIATGSNFNSCVSLLAAYQIASSRSA